MIAAEETTSLLLLQFRDFYGELIKLKRLIKAGQTPSTGSPDKTPAERMATAVSERLAAVMEQQSILAGRRGTDYTGIYRQTEYVMAALADETLLHIVEWEGKGA